MHKILGEGRFEGVYLSGLDGTPVAVKLQKMDKVGDVRRPYDVDHMNKIKALKFACYS